MKKFKDIKLKAKLTAVFLLIGILPLSVLGIIAVVSSGDTISRQVLNQLVSVRELKKAQVESFFQGRINDISAFAENPFAANAVGKLKEAFEKAGGVEKGGFAGNNNGQYNAPESYKTVHDRFHPVFKRYMEKYGYHDILLLGPENGDILFTVTKQNDFGKRASLIESSLKTVWQKAVRKKQTAISDTRPYPPSDELPAQFITAPIVENGKITGVLAFELSFEHINEIVKERSGMGKTAESYLVGQNLLMRSESYLDPENRSVTASFRNPDKGAVDTEPVRRALSGKTGNTITKNYSGNTVLSAYTPVEFGDVTWALVTEIDKKEAFASISKLEIIIGVITAAAAVFIIATAFIISRSITIPIRKGVHMAERMAQGDLTQTLNIEQQDEVGALADSLNHMSQSLQKRFREVADGVNTLTSSATELSTASDQITSNSADTAERSRSVASAAEQMSTNMDNVAAATEQTSSNIQMIVSSAEEMSSTIKEIADNTARSNETTSDAVEKAKNVSRKVDELGSAAEEINKVTETIADISEQTNLLALNATIEAARAGEAGKGFAVVAQEIKDLAGQTAEATRDIAEKISGVQTTTSESVSAIEAIVEVINEVNEIVTSVATSIEEQSSTTREISTNVSQAAEGVQEVNENVNQASTVAKEVTNDISEVSQSTEEMSTGSTQVNQSAKELSRLAEDLGAMTRKFKI